MALIWLAAAVLLAMATVPLARAVVVAAMAMATLAAHVDGGGSGVDAVSSFSEVDN